MSERRDDRIAIVGVGAILPDAPNAPAFWQNIKAGRYSIGEVSPDRWDPDLYYDPDPKAPDKTYSKIGGWVREWEWDPRAWGLPIPPRVGDAMDDGQKWALACTLEALTDYGYVDRPFDNERTAVILGNAMAGEKHYFTSMRAYLPEFAEELARSSSFDALPNNVQAEILSQWEMGVGKRWPEIDEDTMPGELSNCIAGRVANLMNFRGPNFTVDAACASALAATAAAMKGLAHGDYDVAITGGIDRNMGAPSFIKFCKIRALSASGTRPYDEGADGFVMGEGSAVFVLKRLADAERDGDSIYAVVRALAGSSDGKGKAITAPNPIGQRLAVERAWRSAGVDPGTATYVEGHGTSTRVGDVVEVASLNEVFGANGRAPGTIALGSVKSNIGHLKSAAGAAGLLKTVLALRDKVLPPSLHFNTPNPNIDWKASPFFVNTELREWEVPPGAVRRAGVSAFGFGGTNFHAVMEEYVPGSTDHDKKVVAVPETKAGGNAAGEGKVPLRGAMVAGADSVVVLEARLRDLEARARSGEAPAAAPPDSSDLRAPERIAIDYGDAAELADKAAKALRALASGNPAAWKMLRAKGVFRGSGPAPRVAFVYTGQGSQYVNMVAGLRISEPVVADTFAEADRVTTSILGRPLSEFIFVDPDDPDAYRAAEASLMRTAITQPAILATDLSLTRLLGEYGIAPDMVMGHSLGEYGALVAAGALPFADALEAVAARGAEMTKVSVGDNGKMAAVFGALDEIERLIAGIDGYVVIANLNSHNQAVIGGASDAVDRALAALTDAGFQCMPLPVSHAFHTSIVAPASEPLKEVLARLRLEPPKLPIVANVNGEFYPEGSSVVPEMIEMLGRQVASPVQFVKGLETLYEAGARVFVEVGPKKALHGFVDDVLGDKPDVLPLFTNHPKIGEIVSFNHALCGLYAAGLGMPARPTDRVPVPHDVAIAPAAREKEEAMTRPTTQELSSPGDGQYAELGKMFAEFLDKAREVYPGAATSPRAGLTRPVAITGASLGLPGTDHIFDDGNLERILRGDQFIDVIPTAIRKAMVDKHVTRLVKREDGDPTFELIDRPEDVIKLAARGKAFDVVEEFGVPAERLPALDRASQLAIAAGIDALRDAGIPLVMQYKTTTKNTKLPTGWRLPEAMRDDTGVIFASAFPGFESFAKELRGFQADLDRREQLTSLKSLRARLEEQNIDLAEVDRRIHDLEVDVDKQRYSFDRRFLFRVLSMGHSQFAELIGARGPNTQINSACASTTQAIALAEDWILAGRCNRVVILAADDATSDNMLEWVGAGFLASGAAATDEVVEEAATPFDRRRHGMIIGMGAAGIVVERAEAAVERGIRPICEVLSTVTANSAFHGTRLDATHISQVMEEVVSGAEARWGISRDSIAPRTLFVSHETYTPARGGSAAAEVEALRTTFGDAAGDVVIANTKGFTGHPMGVGIEDVVAVKSLETGVVPPVPNYKEPDPELGELRLSKGGIYPVDHALRLAAGFGSQISMVLLRWVPSPDGTKRRPDSLGYEYRIADGAKFAEWLGRISGADAPELEVVKRTLRVVDRGPARKELEPEPVATPVIAKPEEVAVPSREPEAVIEPAPAPEPVAQTPAPEPVAETPAPEPVAETPAPEPVPSAPAPAALDDVARKVLALVAEKTGYPEDMLDLDLDLEADLGVDTVKQAELFATIREAYSIPRDDNIKLRDFPTLQHVIGFVLDRTSAATAPVVETPAPEPAPALEGTTDTSSMIRRIPVPVLRPALDVCKPTGVRLDKTARVLLMHDAGGVGAVLATDLRARGVEVLEVLGAPETDALVEDIAKWRAEGPIQGVYWLPGLDPSDDIADLGRFVELNRIRVKLLFATMRTMYEDSPFLVSGTRLGGQHGYGLEGAVNPIGGAVTGFAKAYARERDQALVKAVDFEPAADPQGVANALVAETLKDPGAVEIGYRDGFRWTIGIAEKPAEGEGLALDNDSVFVVTGAAGSIVAAIVSDLAKTGGTFHLLDLAPAPDASDHDLARFTADRESLKRDLFERIKQRGERATPAMVEKELAVLERKRAALDAIEAIETNGGSVRYHQLDLTDAEAVDRAIGIVREESGRIDVLVHAAGLEISHSLPDKQPREFDLVFDVKSNGWFNLLNAIGDMPIGATVAFSSVAGRFGNAGQTDYSAANDLLCKSSSSFRNARPSTRGIAIDWTAWAGIGMATRGSIPKMMEQAGIDMLHPSEGIRVVRRELTHGTTGEVLIAGALGVLSAPFDGNGGIDPNAVDRGPMVGEDIAVDAAGTLRVRTTLDPKKQAFLYDHQIEGTPVLPGAMGIEAIAEAALLFAPGWSVAEVSDVRFAAPFKFYRQEPRTVTITATFEPSDGGLLARCAVIGERLLPNQEAPVSTTHFTGTVRLGPELSRMSTTPVPEFTGGVGADDIYRVYFHGPAYRVLDGAEPGQSSCVGLMMADLPADRYPADAPLVMAPRLIELCFQTAGVWELATKRRFALPQGVGAITVFPGAPSGRVSAIVTPVDEGASFEALVVDESGRVFVRLSGYRTVELPGVVEDAALKPLTAARA